MKPIDKIKKAYFEFVNGSRFINVYKGGHHDIYCNGRTHFTISGGAFGKAYTDLEDKVVEIQINFCDCDKYKKASK